MPKTVDKIEEILQDQNTVDRLLEKISQNTVISMHHQWGGTRCQLWTADLVKGYPKLYYEGAHFRVCRLQWALHHPRPLPDHFDMHHHCQRKDCVNVMHLQAIPSRHHRRVESIAHNPWGGEKNSQARLTNQQAREIRASGESPEALAQQPARESRAYPHKRPQDRWSRR